MLSSKGGRLHKWCGGQAAERAFHGPLVCDNRKLPNEHSGGPVADEQRRGRQCPDSVMDIMREDWERQTDVIALDRAQVAALLAPVFPGAIVNEIETTQGGRANTNLKVMLSQSAMPVLLRLFVRDGSAGAKEVAILKRLAGRVPVPGVLHFAEDNPITGHPYALLEWVAGLRMDQALADLGQQTRCDMVREAGRCLAGIAAVTFEEAGFLAPDLSIASAFATGSAGFQTFLEEMLAEPCVAARLDPTLGSALLAFAKSEAAILDDLAGAARLTHCDYDPSNILLREEEASWKVAAVLDWEFAVAATPLIDLGHLLRSPWGDEPDFAAALARGYREAGGELAEGWFAAARMLDLLAWLDFLNRPGERPKLFADAQAMIRRTIRDWPAYLQEHGDGP